MNDRRQFQRASSLAGGPETEQTTCDGPKSLPYFISHPPLRSQGAVECITSRTQSTLIPGAGLIACLDSLAAVAGVVAVWVSLNLSSMPADVDSFLSARITVKNVLLLILLATAWPVVFHLFGLYEARAGTSVLRPDVWWPPQPLDPRWRSSSR